MKASKEIGFVISLILAGFILHLASYDTTRVALRRMDLLLRQQPDLKEQVGRLCASVSTRGDSIVDKFFRDRLAPVPAVGTANCNITVVSSYTQRYGLRTHWDFLVHVTTEAGAVALDRSFLIEFPRPLVFLPFAGLLLALIFDVTFWGLGWTLGSYLFLMSGGNAIRTTELSLKSAWLAMRTEPTFIGLFFILVWLALYRSQSPTKPMARPEGAAWEGLANRCLTAMVGLWNPAVYTILGRLVLTAHGALTRITPFLDGQFIILCSSLYLLSFDFANLKEFVDKSLLLPRYFTFTAMLFFAINYWTSPPRKQTVVWNLPHFWRSAIAILIIELASMRIPWLRAFPRVLRVGVAAVVAELSWPMNIQFKQAFRILLPSAGALFLAAFIAVASQEAGMQDLVITLLEPRVHPTGVVLFTFAAGLLLGFLTGNFSVAFFGLFTIMAKSSEVPLVRAAMLDGILAGNLLSPFSVFNLFPAAQFAIPLQKLIAHRFKQLTIPLLIGGGIYAVSAMNSVAILQPVTFVFLCLVALTFHLKRSSWHFGRMLRA